VVPGACFAVFAECDQSDPGGGGELGGDPAQASACVGGLAALKDGPDLAEVADACGEEVTRRADLVVVPVLLRAAFPLLDGQLGEGGLQ
jgi:hypothetical protein